MKLQMRIRAFSLFLAFSCIGKQPEIQYVENPSIRSDFGVGPSNVCLPLRRVLLIRSRGRYYAARLNQAFVSRDNSSFAAVFSVSTFADGVWTSRTQRAEERQLRGPGHPFMFQTGNTRVTFDTFTLRFNGPACVSMYQYNSAEADQGLAFAPTAWNSLPPVHLDSSLKWYSVDLNRSIDVQVENLPGYK